MVLFCRILLVLQVDVGGGGAVWILLEKWMFVVLFWRRILLIDNWMRLAVQSLLILLEYKWMLVVVQLWILLV